MKYTEIGHRTGETQWVYDESLQVFNVGSDEQIDEASLGDCWHGRYDRHWWCCSIVPSTECRCLTEPPESLLEQLRARLSPIARYYYFGGGKDDVEPMESNNA